MALFVRSENVDLDPRTPGPTRRLDVYVALGTAAFACLAYVVTLFTSGLPPHGLAVVLFTAVPVFATVALLVLQSRARAEADAALTWVCGGLLVAVVALALQLMSFPEVSTTGGLLGTGGQSRSALFLLYHFALAAGAVAGALGVSLRWWLPGVVAGVTLSAVLALDAVRLPFLLRPDGTYTATLESAQWVLAAVVAGAAVLWVLRVGRAPSALRGWVGVALSLSTYDVALNAIGGARFDPVWWSSLSVRGATYGVLALGCTWSVLAQLRDVESYSDRELLRRETQLRGSLALTRRLLRCAADLARAVTPEEVASVLCADAVAMTGVPYAATLAVGSGGALQLLGTAGYDAAMRARVEHLGWDAPLPGPRAALTGAEFFLSSKDEVRGPVPRDRHPAHGRGGGGGHAADPGPGGGDRRAAGVGHRAAGVESVAA